MRNVVISLHPLQILSEIIVSVIIVVNVEHFNDSAKKVFAFKTLNVVNNVQPS